MTKVTYGADPEFFVKEKATGTVIPACGLFGGDKGAPVVLSKEGGYLEDGVTIEINVSPSPDIASLVTKIQNLKSLFHQRFPQHELVTSAYADFKKSELRKHPKAMVIGCNADLLAWGVRRIPQISDFGYKRFAGGHLHIGLDPWPEAISKQFLVRWLDVFALLPNITKSSTARFPWYGRPGLYRETNYGVEWRTPDAYWVDGHSNIALSAEYCIGVLLKCLARNSKDVIANFEYRCNREGFAMYMGNQDLASPHEFPIRWSANAMSFLELVAA